MENDPELPPPPKQVENDQLEDEKMRSHDARNSDPESQQDEAIESPQAQKQSAFKSLGWLDRYLAVWILLAIIVGILLGNFAPRTQEVLNRGQFVGVSVPIGTYDPTTYSNKRIDRQLFRMRCDIFQTCEADKQ